MGCYVLTRKQILPISIEEAWSFFSSPENLKDITPPYLNFKILSKSGSDIMYAGQIITYHVRPLLNIPLFWMTEITHVEHGKFFVDEQRFGPYAFWHHQHHFKPVEEGVEMTDIVHYKLPLGILGKIAHFLFVKKQLNEIFDYRFHVLEKKFGTVGKALKTA
ncbi:MAG: SRPBCC family protein [Chitinophagales bacterium]|nr:SRPBCC family protein [Chitinophagales bacterium]MDW8274610.1 SRPBCC family protein [Chitinophagales bacterium]